MKYIRTKDGIIEKSKIKFLANGQAEITDGHGSWRIDDLQIVKGSDDLEELFDAYIGMDNDGMHYMSKAVYKAFKHKISKRNVYGCVCMNGEHGEPIIKSAAKWNEKGDWELL